MSIRYSCLFYVALLAPLSGQETTVWRIGTFDHASAEFGGRRNNPNVVVDADAADAAKNWPAVQFESQSRTISFHLADAPTGAYVLDLAILVADPRVPHLDLELNGVHGTAFIDRRLSYHAEGRADSPINSEARERIPIPAAALHQGENRLRISSVVDPPADDNDSRIQWDALALLRTGPQPAEPAISIEPSYLFVNENGAARELIDVTVAIASTGARGSLTLTLAGAPYRADLDPARFGQQRFEFRVPEFAAGSEARAVLDLDGRNFTRVEKLTPKRKFTVDVVPHMHLDIGYTDYQPRIEELQNRNLDRLLAEMRHDPDMRFSLDGAFLAEQYLRTRSPAARTEFLDAVRAGRISIPAQYANLMGGGASLETLIRSTYEGHALNRAVARQSDYANITDVPAYPWSYASVLAAAGVKYFAAGANVDRGPQALLGRWQTRSPFWWEGPDGRKVLMAYTKQYSNLWFICGMPAHEPGCRDGLPTFLQTFESPGYRPDTVLMFGTQAENRDLISGEGEFVRAWNAKYAWPRLQLATFRDYFQIIEKRFGNQLDTVRGDFGPYWEDGIATDSQFAANYRATENRALAVEKLSSLAALQKPEWAPPIDRLQRLWRDLVLYAEHTYTASQAYNRPESDESVLQIESKHFYVSDARETAHWIAQESFSRLLDNIRIEPSAVVVFNSLSHQRSGLVEVDLVNGMQLVDTETNQPAALESMLTGTGYRRVRFMAEKVPAMGYRIYHLEPGRVVPASPKPKPANTIENQFYRVTVDSRRGAISSILDKQTGRELVDPHSPYLLDQYLYVTGGDNTRMIHIYEHLPTANLEVGLSTGASEVHAISTPWGQSLNYRASGPHAPRIDVAIRLFNGEKKIEILNRVQKEPVSDKEAVYFAFPFAAEHPEFTYEGQEGTVNPARDELAGGCREWYAAGHWAQVSGGGISAAVIPVDAPLVTFGDIDRGLWPERFEPKSSTIFSYVLTNYWHTNFPRVQSGELTYRYVILSGAELDTAHLSRLGRESLTPLEIGELGRNDKEGLRGSLPAKPASFLGIDADNLEIETFKPAEDGEGYIVRLLETGGREQKVRLSSDLLSFSRAWLSTATEDKLREIPVAKNSLEVTIPRYGVVTLRVLLRYQPVSTPK